MPKTWKRGRGGTSASTTTHRTTRPSTRAATIASSGAAGGSRTDHTSPTQVPRTQEPVVSLSDLLELIQGQAQVLSELQAQHPGGLTSSPTAALSAATSPSQGTEYTECFYVWCVVWPVNRINVTTYETLVTPVDSWTSYCTLPNVRNHKSPPGCGNLSQGFSTVLSTTITYSAQGII